VLSAISFVVLVAFTNLLAAALAVTGGAYYVVVYTVWLKRSTSQNIVIGGAAGAMPALSGWAAAHGELGLGAWLLFAIVLVWTPPHFWALALLLKRHYAAADVPMLPVVKGARATSRQVLAYTVLLLLVTLIPVLTGTFGPVYAVAAVALGGVFTWLAWRLWHLRTPAAASVVFHYSLVYLALLFVAVAVDATVR
jgi:protoheme IX farnesyltransferase